ncbi:uncharacterized protein TNCV_257111 [Trichonephila clavipes]|nr:uncharacterized protein TNCV_257111 [Trichonephila clavipes]
MYSAFAARNYSIDVESQVLSRSKWKGKRGGRPLITSRVFSLKIGVEGLVSNSGEDKDVCKCIVPSWHEATLNSRRAESPLVRLVERKERWEAFDQPQGSKLGWTQANRTVTCMVLKAKANRRKTLALSRDEFRGP